MQRHEELKKAFEAAYEEFLEPMFRYFYFRLNDRDRAKELAQETFMRTWDYARKGKEIHSMKLFLYTTASNLFKNELRGRRPVISLDALIEEEQFDRPSDEASSEEMLEARLLMKKVQKLSPRYQEALMLRYVDGLSLKEVGDALGKSEGAAAVQVHRAIQQLKKLHEKS